MTRIIVFDVAMVDLLEGEDRPRSCDGSVPSVLGSKYHFLGRTQLQFGHVFILVLGFKYFVAID